MQQRKQQLFFDLACSIVLLYGLFEALILPSKGAKLKKIVNFTSTDHPNVSTLMYDCAY